MNDKPEQIREIARKLSYQSVSSNSDPSALITKADLERFRNHISNAFLAIADVLDS